jgi:hypothetical protein
MSHTTAPDPFHVPTEPPATSDQDPLSVRTHRGVVTVRLRWRQEPTIQYLATRRSKEASAR